MPTYQAKYDTQERIPNVFDAHEEIHARRTALPGHGTDSDLSSCIWD